VGFFIEKILKKFIIDFIAGVIMIDYKKFLLEVFGDISLRDNEIFSKFLEATGYKIKHPVTCDRPADFYRRKKRIEFQSEDDQREITLVGTQESGPLYFVSSSKNPKSGVVNRLWIDNLTEKKPRIYCLSWQPDTDYLILAGGCLNSDNEIKEITIDLYDRQTLLENEIKSAEEIAVFLAKREFVQVMYGGLIPSKTVYISSEGNIPYSNLIDAKSLSAKILPKRKSKLLGNIAKMLKRLGN